VYEPSQCVVQFDQDSVYAYILYRVLMRVSYQVSRVTSTAHLTHCPVNNTGDTYISVALHSDL